MIHEKIVLKDKQSVESIVSKSESSRSMKNNRQVLIILVEIFDNKFENANDLSHTKHESVEVLNEKR